MLFLKKQGIGALYGPGFRIPGYDTHYWLKIPDPGLDPPFSGTFQPREYEDYCKLAIGSPVQQSSMSPVFVRRKNRSAPYGLPVQSSRKRPGLSGMSRRREICSLYCISISLVVPWRRRVRRTRTTAVYAAAWITKSQTLPRSFLDGVTYPRDHATGSARQSALRGGRPRLMQHSPGAPGRSPDSRPS